MEIKLYATPEIQITEEDLKKDIQSQMRQLVEETKDMDKKKLEEEVFVSYKLNLCKQCRDTFNMRLKQKEFV